jgi:putative FmdB family regulatory protein
MPLYEYECKSCDQLVEILVRASGDTVECPQCGDKQLERVLSVPAAPAFKGRTSLPVAAAGESCGAPRCCGGGCQL